MPCFDSSAGMRGTDDPATDNQDFHGWSLEYQRERAASLEQMVGKSSFPRLRKLLAGSTITP
jgi:hypothetical protein